MSIKTKIENYFNFYIERQGLIPQNNDVIDLANELITNVYAGKTVELPRISELDVIYEQILSNIDNPDVPNNDIERQIELLTSEMNALKDYIVQFFDVMGTQYVTMQNYDGRTYRMSVIAGEIEIKP